MRKLFSLLMLALLFGVGVVWADTTIYDFNTGTGKTDGATGSPSSFTANTSFKLGSGEYIIITPITGETFKNGDAVEIVGSVESAGKDMGLYLNTTDSSGGSSVFYTSASKNTSVTAKGSLPLTKDASALYLYRYGGTSTTITSLTIKRSTDPVVSLEVDNENVGIGDKITLTATHKNFTATPTISYTVAIDGAAATAISSNEYTPAAAGTYVFKATATNGDSESATSNEVTVTVSAYLVKAEYNTTSKKADVTGTMTDATADVSVSSSGKLDKGKYFGIKATAANPFKIGDLVKLHFTTIGGTNNWCVFNSSTASAATLIYSSETDGTNADLSFTLTSDQTAVYLARDAGGAAPYGTWNPTLGYIEVVRPTSIALDGVKVEETALAAEKYSVSANTITLSDSYTVAPTVALVMKSTFVDETTSSMDVAISLAKSGDNFTGTATIGGTTYTINVPVKAISVAPVFTTDLEATYSVAKTSTKELTVVATDAESYKWYKNSTKSTEGATEIDGATSASYTYTGITKGMEYIYCIATNSIGSTTSTIAAITTLGSTACQLTSIQFSNTAYGSINETNVEAGTTIGVVVPYLAGTDAPTVDESSIKVSTGATAVVNSSNIVVTAEDGTTTATYPITTTAITPLTVTADVEDTAFSAVPSWIYNPYGYDSDKGVKFAKAKDESSNMRIAKGNTRQYYFININAAYILTLTSFGTSRKINVYVNGTKLSTPTATGTSTIDIALDPTQNNMVCIESNQTAGDGGFTKYAISSKYTRSVTSDNYGTICLPYNATVEGATLYTISAKIQDASNNITGIALEEATSLEAGKAYIFKATATTLTATYTTRGTIEANIGLVGNLNADDVTVEKGKYIIYNNELCKVNGAKVTCGQYKAYIDLATITDVVSEAPVRIMMQDASEEIATATENIENSDEVVKFFENGQLFIQKNGVIYNALGQIVK